MADRMQVAIDFETAQAISNARDLSTQLQQLKSDFADLGASASAASATITGAMSAAATATQGAGAGVQNFFTQINTSVTSNTQNVQNNLTAISTQINDFSSDNG